MISYTPEETEKERTDLLAELYTNSLPEGPVTPGSHGMHEALHATSILLDSVDRHIMSHQAILESPEFFRLAHEGHTALFNLYQAIGAAHVEAIPED